MAKTYSNETLTQMYDNNQRMNLRTKHIPCSTCVHQKIFNYKLHRQQSTKTPKRGALHPNLWTSMQPVLGFVFMPPEITAEYFFEGVSDMGQRKPPLVGMFSFFGCRRISSIRDSECFLLCVNRRMEEGTVGGNETKM